MLIISFWAKTPDTFKINLSVAGEKKKDYELETQDKYLNTE